MVAVELPELPVGGEDFMVSKDVLVFSEGNPKLWVV